MDDGQQSMLSTSIAASELSFLSHDGVDDVEDDEAASGPSRSLRSLRSMRSRAEDILFGMVFAMTKGNRLLTRTGAVGGTSWTGENVPSRGFCALAPGGMRFAPIFSRERVALGVVDAVEAKRRDLRGGKPYFG